MDHATIVERTRSALPTAVLETSEFRGQLSLVVDRKQIAEVARFLRDDADLNYNFLENLCGVDYLGREPRFEVVYHLLSHRNRHRVCLKVGVPEADPTVPTLTGVWPTANWQEREVYDMFGIPFDNHPDLRRILMPEDWDGHPQRKDYPLGYETVQFSFNYDEIDQNKPYAKE